MSLKILSAIFSIIFGLAVFIPYYVGIWKKEVKPHLFSWLTWTILTGLGSILSYLGGGGVGSILFAIDSVFCCSIAVFALFKGEKNITRIDWVMFISSMAILCFYVLTRDALLSVVLAALIDFLGFLPTFRKSYLKPKEEPILTYFLSIISWLFSLGGLGTYSIVTLFYPATLIFTNTALVLFLISRRKTIL